MPAYNEERKIPALIKELFQYVDKVIVCDDGSTDKTTEVAEKAGATVIVHGNNMGKGAALKSLFNYVRDLDFDVLVTIDGDGQFLPSEIPRLIEPIKKNKYDVVIGYRFIDSEMPAYRKFGNKLLDKLTNAASDLPFRDTQSGYRAYTKKAIQQISFTAKGFGADSEILVSASRHALRIGEEKVTVKYDTGGATSTRHPLAHGTAVLTLLLELIAVKHPLAYLGLPGLFLVVIGILFSVVVISLFNETRYFSVPNTLLSFGSLFLGILLILTAVILFAISRLLRR